MPQSLTCYILPCVTSSRVLHSLICYSLFRVTFSHVLHSLVCYTLMCSIKVAQRGSHASPRNHLYYSAGHVRIWGCACGCVNEGDHPDHENQYGSGPDHENRRDLTRWRRCRSTKRGSVRGLRRRLHRSPAQARVQAPVRPLAVSRARPPCPSRAAGRRRAESWCSISLPRPTAGMVPRPPAVPEQPVRRSGRQCRLNPR